MKFLCAKKTFTFLTSDRWMKPAPLAELIFSNLMLLMEALQATPARRASFNISMFSGNQVFTVHEPIIRLCDDIE